MSWVPPWKPGTPQARCVVGDRCVGVASREVQPEGGLLVQAVTLVNGRCVQCVAKSKMPEPEKIALTPVPLFEVDGA